MNSTQTPSFTRTLLAVNGVELEVFQAGPVGQPIVLCHGWPDHAETWTAQVSALVQAGFHVIAPNQRGYGRSSRPTEVSDYGLEHLTADLVGLLDHFGYASATFVGHDWGAMVVWGLALLHPERVDRVVAFSVPYQVRTPQPWVAFLEQLLGPEHYMVDFNRRPGAADRILEANTERFLRNLYRKNLPPAEPTPGNGMVQLALAVTPAGDPLLSDSQFHRLLSAFQHSGFSPSIHWYRNLDHNWALLADVDPIISKPALMIYSTQDPVQASPLLREFVPRVEILELDAGHWIHREQPEATNHALLDWLAATSG